MKVRSQQLTSITFRMSECLHLDEIQHGSKWTTRCRAPKQSDTTSTYPDREVWTLLMLTERRWIAIRPCSLPLYALAPIVSSAKDAMICPRSFAHSRTKAAEHKLGYSCLMYDPSMTVMREPSWMAPGIHCVPPSINMCSHSHVHPQSQTRIETIPGKGHLGLCGPWMLLGRPPAGSHQLNICSPSLLVKVKCACSFVHAHAQVCAYTFTFQFHFFREFFGVLYCFFLPRSQYMWK